jgi:IclR family transcriptional regulator, acetate operon repressor
MATADAPNPNSRPLHPIASVDNALTLLLMLRDHEQVRIADASRVLGVAPSTASRLMAMLQYHGFVVQDAQTKAYRSGPVLIDIGLNSLRRMDVRRQVRPYLERLAREVDETVHFLVLDGANSVFLDGVEGRRAVRTTLRLGERRPAHCTSGGKALLATLTAVELRQLYPNTRLVGLTDQSIATRRELEHELEKVSAQGYGTSIRESEPDIAGVAMVIRDYHGAAVGALAISMPLSRYDDRVLEALLGPLRAASLAASEGITQTWHRDSPAAEH